jgi:hypothetical protein
MPVQFMNVARLRPFGASAWQALHVTDRTEGAYARHVIGRLESTLNN